MKNRFSVRPQLSLPHFIRFSTALVTIVAGSAHALAPNWNTAVDGNWSDTTKWSTGLAPVAGDTVTFNAAAQDGNESIYLDGNRAALTLTFANTGTTTLLGGLSDTPASSALALGNTSTAITAAAGAGAVTIGDTAASPTAPVVISFAAGGAIVNNSSSTLTIANRFTGAGVTSTARGIITFTGAGTANDATRSTAGALRIGNGSGGGGVVNINGFLNATFTSDDRIINGATLNWNATGQVGPGGSGTTGGIVSIGSDPSTTPTTGTLNVLGGVLTVAATTSGDRGFSIGGSQETTGTSGANGLLNISGGSVVISNNATVLIGSAVRSSSGGSGNGTLTIGGTDALFNTGTTTGLFRMGNTTAAVGTGTININTGGTLATLRNLTKGGGAGAVATVNFDGGTLRANGTALNMTNLTAVNVKAGGAIIDTNNFNVSISSAFLNGTGGADGGLAKNGAGTLTLGTTNTYTGATSVTGGTLLIGSAGSINSSSGITVNGSDAKLIQTSSVASTPAITLTQGTLDGTGTVGAVAMGNGTGGILTNGNGTAAALTLGSLSFGGAATVDIVDSAATPSARLVVTGALATTPANGQVTVNVSGSLSNGLNNLIGFGSFAGSLSDFTLGTTPVLTSRQNLGALSFNGNNLALTIIGDSPKWTGRDSSEWVVGTTGANANWKLITGGGATDYIEGDAVLFDDSATTAVTPGTVNISVVDVLPTVTTFDNSTINYVVGGGFGIGGAGSLVKNGTAKTTLGTINSYLGTTTISAGTLSLQNSSALGTSAGATVASGAAIELQGDVAIGSVPLTLNGAGLTASPAGALRNVSDTNSYAGVVTLGSNATIQSDAGSLALSNSVQGSGTLTVTGAGSVTLTGSSSYTGGTIVNGSTLIIDLDEALGAVPGVEDADNVILNGSTLRSGPTSLGTTRGITLSGGEVVLSATGGTVNVNGKVTGSANLTIANVGSGDRIALGSSANDFTGLVTIASGILNVNPGGGALGNVNNGITFTGNSTLQKTTTGTATLVSTRTVTINSDVTATMEASNATGALTVNGLVTGAGSLTKISAGTVTLSGANTYTGATTVNGGTLNANIESVADVSGAFGVNSAVTMGTAASAILNLNGFNTQIGSLGGGGATGGNVALGAATLTTGGGNKTDTYAGVISGTGGLTKIGTGTQTLTGANTYTGTTTVTTGILSLANPVLSYTAAVEIATSGASLELSHGQTDSVASLSIGGTPQLNGTYGSMDSLTATYKIPQITGPGILHVGPGFESFMDGFPGLTTAQKLPGADPDFDGISNLMEYALAGFDPTVPDASPGTFIGGTLSFTKRADAVANGDITYAIEGSTTLDIDSWTVVATSPAGDMAPISYTLPAGQPKEFARLRISQN